MCYCNKLLKYDNKIKFSEDDKKALNDFYKKTQELKEIYFPKLLEPEYVMCLRDMFNQYLSECVENFQKDELLPLFEDNNNYIFYYYEGPFKGKAFYLDNNMMIIGPIFEDLKETVSYILHKREKFQFDYYSDFADRFKVLGITIEE